MPTPCFLKRNGVILECNVNKICNMGYWAGAAFDHGNGWIEIATEFPLAQGVDGNLVRK